MGFAPDRGFTTTRWSLVIAAGRDATPTSRAALAELCELYWPPLYAYARRRGHSVEEAQDLTQAFFTRLLEKHTVQVADPQRGRFRSFLLTVLSRFLINEFERGQAARRGGGKTIVSLDQEQAEGWLAVEPRTRWPIFNGPKSFLCCT